VAVAAGAAVGAVGHTLSPVRGAGRHPLPPGLHLHQARRHVPARRRAKPRHVRVDPGPQRGARVPPKCGHWTSWKVHIRKNLDTQMENEFTLSSIS
jgi:hypothetical protein